jgi:hypothetical protein
LVAEFGWLPGDHGVVAAAGAADVDDGLVRLACHAVPGLGEVVTVDRAGYTCCVPGQLRTWLRRRDIYAPGSTRWGDPRAELLTPQTWADQREMLCDDLALEPEPATVIGQLLGATNRFTQDPVPILVAGPVLPTPRFGMVSPGRLLAGPGFREQQAGRQSGGRWC